MTFSNDHNTKTVLRAIKSANEYLEKRMPSNAKRDVDRAKSYLSKVPPEDAEQLTSEVRRIAAEADRAEQEEVTQRVMSWVNRHLCFAREAMDKSNFYDVQRNVDSARREIAKLPEDRRPEQEAAVAEIVEQGEQAEEREKAARTERQLEREINSARDTISRNSSMTMESFEPYLKKMLKTLGKLPVSMQPEWKAQIDELVSAVVGSQPPPTLVLAVKPVAVTVTPDMRPSSVPVPVYNHSHVTKPETVSEKAPETPAATTTELNPTPLPSWAKDVMEKQAAQIRTAYEKEWRRLRREDEEAMNTMLGVAKDLKPQTEGTVRMKCTVYEDLTDLSEKSGYLFHGFCTNLITTCNGTFRKGPTKSKDRIEEKARQDYEGDYGRVLDSERCMGLFKTTIDMEKCLRRLEEAIDAPEESFNTTFKVRRVKDRLNNPIAGGYRDVVVNIQVGEKDAFIGELQLTFEEILYIKERSHMHYDLDRVA